MKKDYTYAVARIRALESKMVSPLQFNRMVEAPDLQKAFFVLNETGYGEHISSAAEPFAFEKILQAEQDKTYRFLKMIADKDEALDNIWRKYDYGNAKLLLRGRLKKTEEEEYQLSNYGTIKGEILEAYILKGEGVLPEWLERSINNAIVRYEEEKHPAAIDESLDNDYIEMLRASGDGLLIKLSKIWGELKYPFSSENENRTVEALKEIKRKAFGIEPLITFWMIKALEMRTIRVIFVGKRNNIPTDQIKKRVRLVYG